MKVAKNPKIQTSFDFDIDTDELALVPRGHRNARAMPSTWAARTLKNNNQP